MTKSMWSLALLLTWGGVSLSLIFPTVQAVNIPDELPMVSTAASTVTGRNLRAWRYLRQLDSHDKDKDEQQQQEKVAVTDDSKDKVNDKDKDKEEDNAKTKEWQAKRREQWQQEKQDKDKNGSTTTSKDKEGEVKEKDNEEKEKTEEADADQEEDKGEANSHAGQADANAGQADATDKAGTGAEKREDKEEKEEDKTPTNSTTDKASDDDESSTGKSTPSPSASSASPFSNVNVNVTAMSLTACEQIEMAVAFLTSLDFDKENFMNLTQVASDLAWTTRTATHHSGREKQSKRHNNAAIWDVYLLQLIIMPLSLAMAFCGSNLLLPSCCLAAAGLGVFMVFHFLQQLSNASTNKYASFFQLDCQMKLALGVVSASLSAMLANFFVRFGLFCLGALAAGGGAYLVLDAFPWLMELETFMNSININNNMDPTEATTTTTTEVHDKYSTYATSYDAAVSTLHGDNTTSGSSELTPMGWIITILAGFLGGIFLRWYEQASLEIVTAIMGGVGCAYSIHTFVITQGGQLHRSIVFLIANFMSYFGWRFQRGRRLLYRNQYSHKKNEERSQQQQSSSSYGYSPLLSTTSSNTTTTTTPPPATWDQLQTSINSMQGLLQRSQPQNAACSQASDQAPSAEQIVELTQSLQTLLQRINTTTNTNKEGNDKTGTDSVGKKK